MKRDKNYYELALKLYFNNINLENAIENFDELDSLSAKEKKAIAEKINWDEGSHQILSIEKDSNYYFAVIEKTNLLSGIFKVDNNSKYLIDLELNVEEKIEALNLFLDEYENDDELWSIFDDELEISEIDQNILDICYQYGKKSE